jgi:predicted metal-dependent RNase
MRIANLNPDTDIGASSWFVELDNHRILLDAGMHPKHEGRAGLPLYHVVRAEDVDAITITSERCRWRCGISPGRTWFYPSKVISSSNASCTIR